MPLPRLLTVAFMIALCLGMTAAAIYLRQADPAHGRANARPFALVATGAGLLAAGYLVFAPLTWAGLLIGCAGIALFARRSA